MLLTPPRKAKIQPAQAVTFHCKNSYAKAPQSYVARTLPTCYIIVLNFDDNKKLGRILTKDK
jgi:hypothetical protein